MSAGPLSNLLASANRLQQSFWFKVVASALVVIGAAAISISYYTYLGRLRQENRITIEERAPDAAPGATDATEPDARANAASEAAFREAEKTAAEATLRALNRLRAAQTDPTMVLVACGAVSTILLAVIWLGAGLTALAILLVLGLAAAPMMRFGGPTWRDMGRFIAGVGCLTFAFVVLMQLLKAALSGPNAVVAIARNVVNEAVRIKVSLVFIVLLLFALAALPGMLDAENTLRYRVQSFLQYGTGGTFWIIAILVLFLAVSSVSFEQRDRVIWQTMTKPVAAWQYVLGKWLGVAGVAAVLLGVSSTGVFLFTEYLRDQRAQGESAPYQNENPQSILPTEDRMVLESRVLTARQSVRAEMPDLDPAAVAAEIEERARKLQQSDMNYVVTDAERGRLRKEFEDELRSRYFAIGPGNTQRYIFRGLGAAKESGSPVTLRYKIDIGGNDPKALHRLTIVTQNSDPQVKEIPLGQSMQMTLSPATIDSEGNLIVNIINGDIYRGLAGAEEGGPSETMTFPPDGLEISYSVGSYQANFLRAVIVLWMKLVFLAMIAILAATFLSFSVASLVAFGTFLIAESAGFLFESLEFYDATDQKGQLLVHRVIIRGIAVPISEMFHFYSTLRPTANLVDGQVIAWGRVLLAAGVMGVVTLVLYAIAVTIFRKRELAMYSGH